MYDETAKAAEWTEQDAVPVRESPIGTLVETLLKRTTALEMTFDEMGEQLHSLLTPSNPTGADSSVRQDSPGGSPLALTLDQVNERLFDLEQKIRRTRGRIEI